MNEFSLRPGLLLGVTSGATQADGGALDHSWNDWYAQGRIKDGSNPATAAGHWDRWREDVLLMHRMGIQTCRMGIEWARIEPEEGRFDQAAMDHVREELMLLIGMGIKPLVTLYHFTEPMWFRRRGGWEQSDNVRCFLIYVENVVRAIGHLAAEYLTVDEPNVYAVQGYVLGLWPPGKRSRAAAAAVMSNLAAAHIKAYRLIHDVRRSMGFRNSKVSFAMRLRVFAPEDRRNPLHRAAAARSERLFQGALTKAMLTGEFDRPLRNAGRDRRGSYADFHAVSYDTRMTVGVRSRGARADGYKNDLGWEIYPEGIVAVCRKLLALRPLPIYITAGGTCDLSDSFRCRYLYDHLKALCESGLPVKRYYHCCFSDGFAWLEGRYARFGLVHTDFDTLARSIKRSGTFYSRIIHQGGVTEAMYEEFVAGQHYHY